MLWPMKNLHRAGVGPGCHDARQARSEEPVGDFLVMAEIPEARGEGRVAGHRTTRGPVPLTRGPGIAARRLCGPPEADGTPVLLCGAGRLGDAEVARRRFYRVIDELGVFSKETADGDVRRQDQLAALIWEYLDVFDDDMTTALGHTGQAFRVDTGEALPVRVPQ